MVEWQKSAVPRDVAIGAVNRELFDKFHGRQSCIKVARSKPLPGASGAAFTCGPIKAGGKTISRVSPAHLAVLQAIDSPLLKMVEQVTAKKADEDGKKSVSENWKPKDQWAACYVFTEDIEVIYDMLENEGAPAIMKAARKSFGMNPEVGASVTVIMLSIMEQMARHIRTMVGYAAETHESGQISFLVELPESH